MSLSTFSFPTTTLFGPGALAEVPRRLAALRIHRPLVVTDPGLLRTDAFHLLQNALGSKEQGSAWFLHFGVHANPIEQDVIDAASAFRAHDCDGLVAIGGGEPPGGGGGGGRRGVAGAAAPLWSLRRGS